MRSAGCTVRGAAMCATRCADVIDDVYEKRRVITITYSVVKTFDLTEWGLNRCNFIHMLQMPIIPESGGHGSRQQAAPVQTSIVGVIVSFFRPVVVVDHLTG